MNFRQTRARDADRVAASEVVAAAYVNGQIDRAEHDLRAGRVAAARTLGELEVLLHDLQGAGQGRGQGAEQGVVGRPSAQPQRARGVELEWAPVKYLFAAIFVVVVLGFVVTVLTGA